VAGARRGVVGGEDDVVVGLLAPAFEVEKCDVVEEAGVV